MPVPVVSLLDLAVRDSIPPMLGKRPAPPPPSRSLPGHLPTELWLQILHLLHLSSVPSLSAPHAPLDPLTALGRTCQFFRLLAQEVRWSRDTLIFDYAYPSSSSSRLNLFGADPQAELLVACSCGRSGPVGEGVYPCRNPGCSVRSLLLGPLPNPGVVKHARRQPRESQSYAPTPLHSHALSLLLRMSTLATLELKDTHFTPELIGTLESVGTLRQLSVVGNYSADTLLHDWRPRLRLHSIKLDTWSHAAKEDLELLLGAICASSLRRFGWLRMTERIGLRDAAASPGERGRGRGYSLLRVFGEVFPRDTLEVLDLQFAAGTLGRGETLETLLQLFRRQRRVKRLVLFLKCEQAHPWPADILPELESYDGPTWTAPFICERPLRALTLRDSWNGSFTRKTSLSASELRLLSPLSPALRSLKLDIWQLDPHLFPLLAQLFPHLGSLHMRLSIPYHSPAQALDFTYPVYSLHQKLAELLPELKALRELEYDWDWAPPAFPDCLFMSPSYPSALSSATTSISGSTAPSGAGPSAVGGLGGVRGVGAVGGVYTSDPVIREYTWVVRAFCGPGSELERVCLRGVEFVCVERGSPGAHGGELGRGKAGEWKVFGWGEACLGTAVVGA